LKGKEGRFRYNLSGKRVNFSARTVVSPDGAISINEVGVPVRVADILTVPIRVTDWNISECKQFIMRKERPCVLYAVSPDGKRRKVTDVNREELINALAAGWIIERQLKDGDIVLFNRHPSLHRMSIMAHKVRILPGKTFRVAPSVTPPYNADFDGDEMNIHVPQKEEAKAEAELLMYVQDQIISPRHGHAIIGPTEDHISGTAILTRKDTVFTVDEAADILASCGIYELPTAKEKISGRQLFSLLLPKGFDLSMKTKLCKCERCPKEKCPTEGYVEIKDGKLLYGIVEKKALSKIVEQIAVNYGNAQAAQFIDRVTRMAAHVITLKGFSVSMDNYRLSKDLVAKLDNLGEQAEKEVNALVMQFENGTLERAPGRTLKQTLEDKIMAVLGKVRETAANMIDAELSPRNSAILMAKIGARGSMLNVEQIAGIISQQAVRNQRLKRGYRGRTLSHFKVGDIGARARGYVKRNFTKGLTPIEYFFHSMGSRESLVNTAIRTARSGYMQRRFINALQDLYVAEDLSVRDASGRVIETLYGSDGIDPMKAKKIGEAAIVERE
jgi:DNA-directed RNA polymerase subunit A'